ncbi:hypothetical protein COHA_009349 [Chlorella ohadii]|uniref:Mitochondrial fission process protein 1 n=1 Tax=Chlorella ohadii TaxID=2649997 RepID=A0AAD5DLY9_9CHLO|nr:hypothetical protein COHA_009349 [Chlorella ohadii]
MQHATTSAAVTGRTAAATPRRPLPGRQRRRLPPPAAVQPERQQQEGGQVPDAPPAPRPKGVKVELFETKGMDQSAAGAGAAGDNLVGALLSTIDFSEPMSFDGEEKTEYDPLRDGPLRYLGYANELGEAFAAWLFPGGVPLSYAIAIGYVCFDTYDKWGKTEEDARRKLTSRPIPDSVDLERLIKTIGFERGIDTLVWQLIASVATPGYTIHTVVAAANWALAKAEESSQVLAGLYATAAALGLSNEAFLTTFNKSVPTALGLLAIPFIVHPIDAGVHAVLNATLRPAMRRYICQEAGGCEAGLVICDCEAQR